jgi:beta-glucosidase
MPQAFPNGFLWGVATASYQVEGAVHADGRGESIWDRFSHRPGKVHNGDTGDVACDHYYRYAEDFRLMAELGVKAYRFSFAWPRILPAGKGAINQSGLDFYDRLIDAMLKAGLTPSATLYHWDLPQALQDVGGWMNRATTDHFVQYADVVSRRFGDRISYWATFNEPNVIAYAGHLWGVHAPGVRDLTYRTAMQVSHNINVAHGKAVPVLRANSVGAKVGIVQVMYPVHPATNSESDQAAANRAYMLSSQWFFDPIFKGDYPAEALATLGAAGPRIRQGTKLISAPIDWVGINYYARNVVRDAPSAGLWQYQQVRVPTSEHTEMDWEVYPDGLREIIVRAAKDYAPKEIFVTENGCAMPDTLNGDSRVADPRRVAYLRGHFQAAQQAIAEGAPLKGYFVWSFLDNFEWAWGYVKRFGIVYVDYATQRRIPKDSFRFYQGVIRANAVE